jgi:hypothetical protein
MTAVFRNYPIMPPLAEGPATGSVRPGSNICGAHPFSEMNIRLSAARLTGT